MNVSKNLRQWYLSAKRDLPWRESGNPYFIWLSEIILQQTRVQQGLAYYYRFIEAFPTVQELADAPLQQVMKLWQGLGYYSRARNLHKAARIIVDKYGGGIPDNYKDLRKLPGVGEYTAGAILSLAYNKAFPAMDGNVYRVLARFFGIGFAPDSSQGRKEFKQYALKILDREQPGTHNQAVIELGALVCTPRNPACNECVLSPDCIARKEGLQQQLPLKKKTFQITHRYFYYFLLREGDAIYLKQRNTGDIWAMLWDFPLIEANTGINMNELQKHKLWQELLGMIPHQVEAISQMFQHQLTHQKIHACFIECTVFSNPDQRELKRVPLEEIHEYPLPRLVEKYMQHYMERHG